MSCHRKPYMFIILAVLGLPLWAAADEVQCWPPPPVFPTFDNSCQVDQDCAAGIHQIDCCGSFYALGLNSQELNRFREDEEICELQYPPCLCVGFGILADDGQRTYSEKDVGVRCDRSDNKNGRCVTFVVPE